MDQKSPAIVSGFFVGAANEFTYSQGSPREGLDVDSRIVRRTDQRRQPVHPDLTMLSGWRETGTARSMQRGVDAVMVFGRQLGKTSALIFSLRA